MQTQQAEANTLQNEPHLSREQERQRDTYYKKFEKWCDAKNETPSRVLLQQWDTHVNHEKLRELYASDGEVYAAGLVTIYSRIFYSFTSVRCKRPSNPDQSIVIRSIRKAGEGVGNVADLTSKRTTKAQKQYMIDAALRKVDNAIDDLKLLEMPRKEFLEHVIARWGAKEVVQ